MSDQRASMTPADIERVAHEVRLQIQSSTCCPQHAGDVLLHVMAGFAMDEANDNAHQAAATIMRGAKQLASKLRKGRFVLIRSRQ